MTATLTGTLSPMESMVLRNVLSNDRLVGITPDNKADHDAAVISLIKRGFVRYRPQRARQRFNLTAQGREALAAYERAAVEQTLSQMTTPSAAWAAEIVHTATDSDVLLIAERK